MKKRHNPNKPANNYGSDYDCKSYEQRENGTEWCHNENMVGWWGENIKWSQTDENGKLKCKGNRHNCFKLKLKWLASLSEEEKQKLNK